jgi:ankyrin repeat protein
MKTIGNVVWFVALIVLIAGTWFPAQADTPRDLDRRLMEAVQEGNSARVKALIGSGANVNARDEAGNTALHFATKKDIAGLLISAGASVNEKNDDFEMTPLFNVPAEAAALLIAKGADVNGRARKGMTPLTWAVYWDQRDKVELLIVKGADINAKDDDGKTALHVAANWGKVEIAALLLAKGAKVNARDNDCWTPLHWAAFEATVETMDLLLSSGADRNAASCRSDSIPSPGETPLDVAKRFRSPDVVSYLKSRGCGSSVP